MNAWIWQLRQGARILGATGWIGLGLLASALLWQVIQVESVRQSTLTQQARLENLRLAATAREATPAPPLNPLAMLPPTGEASQLIGELEHLAQVHALELPRGQYSVTPIKGNSLQHWKLVLPLETAYPTLHAFLAAALERMPNLALDELKLKRDRIESDVLQVELRLSLFVEAAP